MSSLAGSVPPIWISSTPTGRFHPNGSVPPQRVGSTPPEEAGRCCRSAESSSFHHVCRVSGSNLHSFTASHDICSSGRLDGFHRKNREVLQLKPRCSRDEASESGTIPLLQHRRHLVDVNVFTDDTEPLHASNLDFIRTGPEARQLHDLQKHEQMFGSFQTFRRK
ncbi:hypothetical protein FQA47_017259 [Oryzias melastigma]|uniref:Uncharacterized protein n=1 Tax=Oryzias melastigma TaxID=30732 RepID=A0A834BZM0_ORYME|nr:hypothetical protein FQA47_017259 [Oryzias melastigma]